MRDGSRKLISVVAALLVTSLAGSSVRANVALDFSLFTTGYKDGVARVVGWEFTVGSQSITLTGLGFYDHDQNGLVHAHDIAIYDYATQAAVATATVKSGTASTLSNLFRYEPIAATTLQANKSYVIAASLPENGDEWLWTPEVVGTDIADLSVDSAIALGIPTLGAKGRYKPFTSTLQFLDLRIGDDRSVFVGPNFTFGTAPVPAPGAALLALIGMPIVGWIKRRFA